MIRYIGKSEELAIFSRKPRSWQLCNRVARLAARRWLYVCDIHLREGPGTATAAYYRHRWERSDSSSTGLLRERTSPL